MVATTLFDKIWNEHTVCAETADAPAVLYIDLHIIHEVTSPQAFSELRKRGLPLRRPDLILATQDHSIPTIPVDNEADLEASGVSAQAAKQVRQLTQNCAEFGIELYGMNHPNQGVVHVIAPELGATQPGKTIVCGDSHTSTHGAFGALAFGIGTTEVGHVLATQCLLQRKPKSMAVKITGERAKGVSAKDIILALIAKIGVGGGVGYVIEYLGDTISGLSMEERMTLCNMSIEAGAKAGLVAPDQTTFDYLKGRPKAPKDDAWEAAVRRWSMLRTDPSARFDKEVELDISTLEPQITYGTNPSMVIHIGNNVPQSTSISAEKSLAYMQFKPETPIKGTPVDVVFVGSCTNGRLSDLQEVAKILAGRTVSDRVRMLIVPGSQAVKRDAEREGLDRIFKKAGAEWREPGCSMCLGMNGDTIKAGQLCVSTSNRNFEGRQGPGGRTVLASPLTAAATAVAGYIADPREYLS